MDIPYSKRLANLFDENKDSTETKFANFPLYTPNNVLSKFLARYELFKMIKNVPGAIIECGVGGGVGISSFQHFTTILEPYNDIRSLIGFDTFCGFPNIAEQDMCTFSPEIFLGNYQYESKREIERSSLVHSSFHPVKPKNISLIQGDIIETVPRYCSQHPELIVALLYLDCDLYEPTKVALDWFLPKMPKGALVVFDELNHPDFPGETIAVLESFNLSAVEIKRFDTNKISYLII